MGGATLLNASAACDHSQFQSTLPVGGATLVREPLRAVPPCISIHAPRGGSDSGNSAAINTGTIFQSTLPVGGATDTYSALPGRGVISIHAPRGGSDDCIGEIYFESKISIHAPRGGSDCSLLAPIFEGVLFQSTLPVGGATLALLLLIGVLNNFNPRSPWGERRAP